MRIGHMQSIRVNSATTVRICRLAADKFRFMVYEVPIEKLGPAPAEMPVCQMIVDESASKYLSNALRIR